MIKPKVVVGSVQDEPGHVEALGRLCRFRWEFYDCLTRRADALFEVADAVLCTDGPVRSSVDLTLAGAGPEHRRGHGALYDGLNSGRLDVARFRRTLAGLTLPSAADGRLMLAVDVSPWLRSEASTSAQRLFCHVHDRAKNQAQLIPGWPYSFVAALEPGRTSWTAVLDAVRLGPADDATAVTADQLRAVVGRLTAAGHWHDGDPNILIVRDAGYDVTRLAFVLDKPATWPEPQHTTTTPTSRYGTATATSWNRLHPRLTHRTCWINHPGDLPIIEGTLIRLQVDHLPGNRDPKPVWLWSSALDATAADIDRAWQAFLRRFDLEHTFRLFKQTLGWTAPKIRDPAAADRWTWLVIAIHTQLRPARPLARDLRRPWEKPAPPGRLTPAHVRRGFRNIRAIIPLPAGAPKPTKAGPGRPPGSRNRQPAPRHTVGKTTRRELTMTAHQQRKG